MTDDPTQRLTLPSGGWADFRTSVKYGARRELRRLSYKIGATANVTRGTEEANLSIAADELANASMADDYYPLTYMLAGWSFDLPLPTMADLSPLDALDWEDGEFLVEKAKEVFKHKGEVDFSPNLDETRSSPTTPSDESEQPSEGAPMTPLAFPKSSTSTAS